MLEQQKLQQSRNIFSNEGQHRIISKIDLESLKLKQMVNQLRGRSFALDESLNNNSELLSKQLNFQKRSYSKDDSQSRLRQKWNILSDRLIEKCSLPSKQLQGFNKNSKNIFFDSKSQRQQILKRHKNVSNATNLKFNHHPHQQSNQINFPIDQSPIQQLIKKTTTTYFRIKQKPQLRKAQQNQQRKQVKFKNNIINNPETGFEVQNLNHQLMIQFITPKLNNLNPNSTPKQIYTFFQQIYAIWNIKHPSHPIIKRYKNCIYFGQKINEDHKTYIGMVWYFKYALYYGEFRNKKKNGLGIQISLKNDQVIIWKGRFEQGSKSGYFSIQSQKFKYFGMLKSGGFHGEGLLINNESQYKGGFVQNQKQGHGLQKFTNKSEYKGQYFNNKFDGEGEFKATNYYYKGWFKRGRPDGYGFQRTAQYEYLGNFQKSKKHGKGTIKTADGIQIECIFKDGVIAKQRISPNKSNEFKNGSKDIYELNEQSSEDAVENLLHEMNKNKLSEDDPLPFHLHL